MMFRRLVEFFKRALRDPYPSVAELRAAQQGRVPEEWRP